MKSRPPITSSVWLPLSPLATLQQFLAVEAMQRWWGVARGLVEPRIGGVWALGWDVSPQGYRYVTTGIIAAYRPEKELRIDQLVYFNPDRSVLGPMRLKFEVVPEQQGCRLKVSQDGYLTGGDWDWYYDAVSQGWPMALELLRRHSQNGC
jgi:Activator of Hsp90 ATPase homolog 1-like protein